LLAARPFAAYIHVDVEATLGRQVIASVSTGIPKALVEVHPSDPPRRSTAASNTSVDQPSAFAT
jgi:hypothetical protein